MAADLRKYLFAAIFLWMVHVWTITISTSSVRDASSSGGPSLMHPDAFASGSSSGSSSSANYDLAKEQSLGYFDDIPASHWKTLQKYHAAMFPNYYQNLMKYSNGPGDRGNIPALRNANMWYGQNFQVEFVCPLARRLPADSMADGPKWVCDPHRLAKKEDCLIYSVGSNGKAEFEKAVKDEIGDHCEVHS